MHLLIDLDGTLTDPFEGITKCIQHALAALNRPAPAAESLRWCIGPPLRQSFIKLLAADDEQLADSALVKYRERFGVIGLYENQVYPGVEEALQALKVSGHELTVATSKPTVYAKRIMDHFGLGKYFRSVDGSELDGTRSDKAELIAYILKRDNLAPENVIMIGDREHDMKGAGRNHVSGIGVLWGYGSKEELKMAGAGYCINAPDELPGVVQQIQNVRSS